MKKGLKIALGVIFGLGLLGAIVGDDKKPEAKSEIVNSIPTTSNAFIIAKDFVKNRLKSPSSADFPFDDYRANVDTSTNTYVVQSYVDAQNAFGANLRSNWVIKMRYKGGSWADYKNWEVVNLEMD